MPEVPLYGPRQYESSIFDLQRGRWKLGHLELSLCQWASKVLLKDIVTEVSLTLLLDQELIGLLGDGLLLD